MSLMREDLFQKNLVVWKLRPWNWGRTTPHMFQKNLVVWKHEMMRETRELLMRVSEELSSVETKRINIKEE